MPIEIAIWRLDGEPEKVVFTSIESETRLENFIIQDITMVSSGLMFIGSQIPTDYGKFIDVLAMDQEGNVSVIELKRHRTPREVVAQLLDYASWVDTLTYEQLANLYAEKHDGKQLEEGFDECFGISPPEKLNESHNLIVVSSELDASTERIINYLGENYGVPINAVFFRYFRDGDNEYITRSWLIDPKEVVSGERMRKKREPWNGRDFYVSLGEDERRTWDDCRKYGYISGGGGKFYSETLQNLFPGARVFVNIPGTGFVGVGKVTGTSTPVTEFPVSVNGVETPILDAPLKAANVGSKKEDPELREYMVPVHWIRDVSREQAHWEKGLFASQHTACKLRNQFTIERLTQHFNLDE